MSPSPRPVHVRWLVRLRWAAIAAQLASIAVVHFVMRAPFPAAPLAAIVGALAAANLWLSRRIDRGARLSERAIALNLVVDSAALTGLLVWTGGAMNPFTTLYIVQVALAAVLVRRRWSLVVAGAAVALFGALLVARPESMHIWHSASMFVLHVRGMWVAFALSAFALWYFIDRVSTALRATEAELAASRLDRERAARWQALGTLAAGTAHELNTPLGSVAILAAELSETLAHDPEARAQADRIREEVRRCKAILARMRSHAPTADETTDVPLGRWVRAVVEDWALARGEAIPPVEVAPAALDSRPYPVREDELRQALWNVLDNARLAVAARPGAAMRVSLTGAAELSLAVTDTGPGIPPEDLARIGEPFFTTREPGQGMGLGLFLVQAAAARHEGRLEVRSAGGETRVAIALPVRSG